MKEKQLPPWASVLDALVGEILQEAEGEGGSRGKVPAPAGDKTPLPKKGGSHHG